MTADSGTFNDTARSLAIPSNPLRALVSPYTWLATMHLMTDIVVGVVTFAITVTLLALSGSLLVVMLVGVPIWIATSWVASGLSTFELARIRFFLGVDIQGHRRPPRRGSASWLRYAWQLVRTGYVWRQLAHQLLHLPLGILNIVLASAAWAVPVFLITLPVWLSRLPARAADLWLVHVTDQGAAVIVAAVGLAALVLLTPNVIRGLAAMDVALARALLGRWSTGDLTERVGELEVTRRRAVDSAEAERRRIERDLHDGAQQRLTSLAMTLGRVQVRMGADGATDPAVRSLIDEAHREAKEAIVELRDLTRGLHPPVLTDRGLDAALSALAARCPVPVAVTVDVAERPSRTIEAIAYFVVAEALTNVAKHSGARHAAVHVRRTNGHLSLTVTDDGRGGAQASPGSGLAGLDDRVRAVDGHLAVTSPAGGPTVLTVELPCR
ncbi:MAG: histidine kinase [Frankiales bacterium]|nr:histidine kinase [Frankiales bacterium]